MKAQKLVVVVIVRGTFPLLSLFGMVHGRGQISQTTFQAPFHFPSIRWTIILYPQERSSRTWTVRVKSSSTHHRNLSNDTRRRHWTIVLIAVAIGVAVSEGGGGFLNRSFQCIRDRGEHPVDGIDGIPGTRWISASVRPCGHWTCHHVRVRPMHIHTRRLSGLFVQRASNAVPDHRTEDAQHRNLQSRMLIGRLCLFRFIQWGRRNHCEIYNSIQYGKQSRGSRLTLILCFSLLIRRAAGSCGRVLCWYDRGGGIVLLTTNKSAVGTFATARFVLRISWII
jgi:hypothetical protein